LALLCLSAAIYLAGCGAKGETPDPQAEAPPPAQVEQETDVDIIKVDHPDQFPLATASERDAAPQLDVNGAVAVDISRSVPVVTLASGRILEIDARLGDTVTKGQLLMKVQSNDIAQAFSDYRQAVADDVLANAQLERSRLLYDKGAIAQKDLEVAQDAEVKAKVTVQTAEEHLRVLGADKDHPTAVVSVYAPISGVITDQQVTAAAGTQGLASPNAFTISDLSRVWVLCDVYENDLHFVRVGEFADIHVTAYPSLPLKGRIDNIGPILDPNIRTAKVRLEVTNPGVLRVGMFVTATFHGEKKIARAVVPSSAVLHLHDRDWVYVPLAGNRFRRVPVVGGDMIPPERQEILSGVAPGDRVVSNALVLQNTAEQ
jgi:cobalt-zinc-cadmium efflux system membrane fusion protein